MIRVASLFLALLVGGCATPVLDSSDVSVDEDGFGLYRKQGDEDLVQLRSTTDIPCELGTTFGAQLSIRFDARSRVHVPVQAAWIHPAPNDAEGKVDTFLPEPFEIERGDYDLGIEAISTLEEGDELVEGQHTLRLFDPGGDRVYYERTFDVSGCR